MPKGIFIKYVVGVIGVVGILVAQAPRVLWESTYGGDGDDAGYWVEKTRDGGFIIVGETSSFGSGDYDVYLIKTDSKGDTLWTKTYGGGGWDAGYSVQETQDGGFIITGWTSSFGAGFNDVYLIKTDSKGDTLWTKTYGGALWDAGYSVQQTRDGGFVIVGKTSSFGSGGFDVYLIRTDPNGDTLWTKTYGGSNEDVGYSVQETKDGGFIIAGKTMTVAPGNYDVYLIRTNLKGNILWTKVYGGDKEDAGYSVQETQDGGFIVAGSTCYLSAPEYTPNYDVYLIKTDSKGDTLWTKTYGWSWKDGGYGMRKTTDEGVVIAGWTQSFGVGEYDIYLIRTDPNGDTLWTIVHPNPFYYERNDEISYSVEQIQDEEFIVVGTKKEETRDVYLLRLGFKTEIRDKIPLKKRNLNVFEIGDKVVISYQVISPENVKITIFDKTGRLIRILNPGYKERGEYKIYWDKKDQYQKKLPSGVYFIRISGEKTNKIFILK